MKEGLPNRQSIRKKGWNYATPGWYFVTCNTAGNQAVFGAVINGTMVLNEAGKMVADMWRSVEAYHPEYRLDAFVVMPTHVHGIVEIARAGRCDGPGRRDGLPVPSLPEFMRRFKSLVVAEYVRGEKAGVYRPISGKLWHRNYWDVIVRDERALANIRRYIRENPRNYGAVMQCGEPRYLGNKALLDLPKLGFLASRGEKEPHGHLPLRKGEGIISGFLSPMERTVFRAALKHGKPMIWVKPWALEEGTDNPAIKDAIAGGRLLVVSPFADQVEAPSMRRAAWCNQYVLAHCERLVIGHLNPEGMLACVLSEADPDLEIIRMNPKMNI